MKIKINLGTIVQKSSNLCDSNRWWSMLMFFRVENRLNPTMEIIKIRIVRVWSWKKINCSIRGDEAFWNPMEDHDGISKGKIFI